MLSRVNNVERDSQIRKRNKWTNSNMWHTETHTRIDKWGRATKEWTQNVESTENALLHNARETLAWLLNRWIRHLCTTYKRQKCNEFYPKYAMYVWFPVFLSRWFNMIGYDNLICNVVWCYGYCLQASLLSFSLLKSLFFFLYDHFCTMHKPR